MTLELPAIIERTLSAQDDAPKWVREALVARALAHDLITPSEAGAALHLSHFETLAWIKAQGIVRNDDEKELLEEQADYDRIFAKR